MSLAVSKNIKPELVLDRRLGFESKKGFGVIKSGQTNTYKVLPTQNYSNQNITFNAQPPSPNISISREILVHNYFQLTFTGTAGTLNGGTVLYPGLYDAPRAMPFAQVTSNIQVNINNAAVSMNTYQVINAFMKANITDDEVRRDFSLAPDMLDTYQNYDDPYTQSYGISNDPLQAYGQNSYFNTRGAFPINVISNPVVGPGNAGTAVVQFESTEPLILSPFLNGNDNNVAFIGVQSLTVQFNLLNMARVWSHSAGAGNAGTISRIDVTFFQAPELLLNFITPSPLQDIPLNNVYSYNTVDIYPQDLLTNVAPNGTLTINSQNIQLNYIPRRILVFVRRSEATSDFTTTDTFFKINNVSINFDNISGVLSGANSQQLYELSKNSGLDQTWTEWSKFIGSVLILDIGRAIMLNDATEAPSLTVTKQFQIQVNVTNLNQTDTISPSLYIVTIADGLISVGGNAAILQNTILSREDILDAGNNTLESHAWEKSTNWFGGKLVESTQTLIHKVKGGASVGGALVGGAAKKIRDKLRYE